MEDIQVEVFGTYIAPKLDLHDLLNFSACSKRCGELAGSYRLLDEIFNVNTDERVIEAKISLCVQHNNAKWLKYYTKDYTTKIDATLAHELLIFSIIWHDWSIIHYFAKYVESYDNVLIDTINDFRSLPQLSDNYLGQLVRLSIEPIRYNKFRLAEYIGETPLITNKKYILQSLCNTMPLGGDTFIFDYFMNGVCQSGNIDVFMQFYDPSKFSDANLTQIFEFNNQYLADYIFEHAVYEQYDLSIIRFIETGIITCSMFDYFIGRIILLDRKPEYIKYYKLLKKYSCDHDIKLSCLISLDDHDLLQKYAIQNGMIGLLSNLNALDMIGFNLSIKYDDLNCLKFYTNRILAEDIYIPEVPQIISPRCITYLRSIKYDIQTKRHKSH